jgi:hypothetical protein
MKAKLFVLFSIVIGSIILMYPALINGYPLVCADSGTYIKSGFLNQVPYDRPIMYGLLIRFLSLGSGLMVFIIAQSFIVSVCIYAGCKHLVTDDRQVLRTYWIAMIVLGGCTGLPWFATWIMPDICSGLSALLLLILLCSPNSFRQHTWLTFLYYLLTLTHLSNFFIHALFAGAALVVAVIGWLMKKEIVSLKRAMMLTILMGLNFVWVLGINYGFERKVFVSQGGTMFFSAKLCDDGLLKKYLDQHCAEEQFRICEFKDSMPDDLAIFLWSPNSVLMKTGWWPGQDKELATINRNILTDRVLLKEYLSKGVAGTMRQLNSIECGQDFLRFGDTATAPYRALKRVLPDDTERYQNSKQNTGTLTFPFHALNTLQYIIVYGSYVLVLILLFTGIRMESKIRLLAAALLLLLNAVICAFLSVVEHRYQGRIVWILVLVLIIEIINNRDYFRKTLKSVNQH